MLVATAWPNHLNHRAALSWFTANSSSVWATCPFTEAGLLRISSNPRIVDESIAPREALQLLRRLTAVGHHQFWPDDLEFASEFLPLAMAMGHQQVTDAYLLGLTIKRSGRLVTFDRSISNLLPSDSPQRDVIEEIQP